MARLKKEMAARRGRVCSGSEKHEQSQRTPRPCPRWGELVAGKSETSLFRRGPLSRQRSRSSSEMSTVAQTKAIWSATVLRRAVACNSLFVLRVSTPFIPPSLSLIIVIRFWAEEWLSLTLRCGSWLARCVRHRRRWLPTRRPKFALRYGRATPCRRTSKSRRPECRR